MSDGLRRINISSGTVWEERVGYSRAVRIGPHIWVTGTIAAGSDGTLLHAGDAHAQMIEALRKIERAMQQAGGSLADIVRTRIYIIDMAHAEAVGRAHRELLGDIKPATTMVQVGALFANALVEVEADAYVRQVNKSTDSHIRR